MLSGKDAELGQKSLRDMFRLAGLGKNDRFYHLGCGRSADGIKIALSEFNVKQAIGIDSDCAKIQEARRTLESDGSHIKVHTYNSGENNEGCRYQLRCADIRDADMSDATVILFWFANDMELVDEMTGRFASLENARVLTVWGPLPGCLPDAVDFPYVMCKSPFRQAQDVREQLQSVFGKNCIDFVTAWEHAERYTKAIGPQDTKNDRFLTIIQTLTIWINAWNLGITCGGGKIPESISTYVKLMKMNFDIDFEHWLEKK